LAQKFGANPQKIAPNHFFEIFVTFAEEFRESVANYRRENEQKEVKVEDKTSKLQLQQEVKKELATRNQVGSSWENLKKKRPP